MKLSALDVSKELIRCPSVTPNEAGCFNILKEILSQAGFHCQEINRNQTKNLWAVRGSGHPFLVFAGHVDVVPPGDSNWTFPPFDATENEGFLYGRGAQDMKSSDAAFAVAASRFVLEHPDFQGSIGLLITSDEEGDGLDGTQFALESLKKEYPSPDFCIVGEPSCSSKLGDTIKNGRRGSLNGKIIVKGIQGHVAYPEKVKNPIHATAALLSALVNKVWDNGCPPFPPTSFQVSNIHAGTGAVNVVPPFCEITFNIRFNPLHTEQTLRNEIESICEKLCPEYEADWKCSAVPFQAEGETLTAKLSEAIQEVTQQKPTLSTAGGTSDGRFIKSWIPDIVEFGPVNDKIHKVDERIPIRDVDKLSEIYYQTLKNIFLK